VKFPFLKISTTEKLPHPKYFAKAEGASAFFRPAGKSKGFSVRKG